MSQHLRRLRDLGLLEQHERGRAAYYTPSQRRLQAAAPSPAQEPLLPELPPLLPELPPLLPELPSLLPELERLRPEFPEVPPDLWASLNTLGKRTQPTAVQDVVRRLCALRPFRLDELARLLRRTPDGVRKNYIKPMLRSGVMEHTAAATPTHPGQAYRTVAGRTEGPA